MPFNPPPGSLPNISIDCTIFGFEDFHLKVLLVRRDLKTDQGKWKLPGGWVGRHEPIDTAAARILEETTGVPNIFMNQLRAFGGIKRFPDDRVITIAYTALINPQQYRLRQGREVREVSWVSVKQLPPLAFDHKEILSVAIEDLKSRIRQEPISFELLPKKFTLPQILRLFESVLDRQLDRRNFRKKLLRLEILVPLNEKQTGVAHRAAQLYRFDREKYLARAREGVVPVI